MHKETLLALLLVGAALLLLDPFMAFMPTTLFMTVNGILVAVTALYAGVLWREKAQDERDALHRMVAGRAAFIAGVAVLVIGITVQTFQHHVDPWLIGALVVTVLAKIIGHLYADRRL